MNLVPQRCQDCPVEPRCVFRQVPEEAFEHYQRLSEIYHFPSGKPIVRQGERPAGVFLLRAGLVRLTFLEKGGRSRTLGLVQPPALLGLTESVTGYAAAVNAETVVDSECEFIARKQFVHFLLATPHLVIPLLVQLSEEYAAFLEAVCAREDSSRSARERLLARLSELAEGCGEPAPGGVLLATWITVQELASQLDLSRQWTSGLLQELMEEGRVRRVGRRLLLTSLPPHEH